MFYVTDVLQYTKKCGLGFTLTICVLSKMITETRNQFNTLN